MSDMHEARHNGTDDRGRPGFDSDRLGFSPRVWMAVAWAILILVLLPTPWW